MGQHAALRAASGPEELNDCTRVLSRARANFRCIGRRDTLPGRPACQIGIRRRFGNRIVCSLCSRKVSDA